MAVIRKPKHIVVKEYGKFIHEVITPKEDLPKTAKFRTIKVDSHRVSVAFWGKQIAPRKHEFYALHKILHPKKRGEPCKLKDRLRLLGVKELETGKEYKVVSKLPKLTGKRRGGFLMKDNPYYVGCSHSSKYEIFQSERKPTRKKFGKLYKFVIGPFKDYDSALRHTMMLTT